MENGILQILIVLTSISTMGESDKETGFWLSELTHPYYELVDRGIRVDIVSINGGKAPIDPRSLDMEDEANKRFMDNPELVATIENSRALKDVNPSSYAAIVFAGGHGTMWDFPDSPAVNEKAGAIYQQGGYIAAICHGPAALLNIKLPDGKPLVSGKNVAAFTNEEEEIVELTEMVPFLLEDALIKNGAQFQSKPAWSENVVVDGRLITGQNPQSAAGVGRELAKLLRQQ